MGYGERSRIIDDEEEWFNIPRVVRALFQQLNDESEASRRLLNAIKNDQKETNELVKRVMQKQTDLEIDVARNQLLLQGEPKKSDDELPQLVSRLRKKIDKMNERISEVEEKISLERPSLSETIQRDIEQRVTAMASEKTLLHEDAISKRMYEVEKGNADFQKSLQQSINSATADIRTACNDATQFAQCLATSTNKDIFALKRACDELKEQGENLSEKERVASQKQKELSGLIERLSSTGDERFSSTIRSIEKLQKFCEEHLSQKKETPTLSSDAVERQQRAFEAYRANIDNQLLNFSDALADVNRKYTSAYSQFNTALEIIEREVGNLRFSVNAASEKALAISGQTERGMNDLKTAFTELQDDLRSTQKLTECELTTLREADKKLALDLKSVPDVANKIAEQVTALGIKQEELSATQRHNRDAVHEELQRISMATVEASRMRDKFDQQLTRLCEVVHNVSKAVELLENKVAAASLQARSQASQTHSEVEARVDARSTLVSSASLAPQQQQQLDEAVSLHKQMLANLSRRVEQVASRVESNDHVIEEAVKAVEKLTSAERLAALERGTSPTRNECSQQQQQLLLELPHALVEIESIKTRIASTEVKMQQQQQQADFRLEHIALSRDYSELAQRFGTLTKEHQRGVQVTEEVVRDMIQTREEVSRLSRKVAENAKRASTEEASSSQTAALDEAARARIERLEVHLAECQKQASELSSHLAEAQDADARRVAAAVETSAVEKSKLEENLRNDKARIVDLDVKVSDLTNAVAFVRDTCTTTRDALQQAVRELTEIQSTVKDLASPPTGVEVSKEGSEEPNSSNPAIVIAELEAKLSKLSDELPARLATLEQTLNRQEEQQRDEACVSPTGQQLVSGMAIDELTRRLEELDARVPAAEMLDRFGDAVASLDAMEERLLDTCYPRAELEERLENLWMSVVSLLARKDDEATVNQKLEDLHLLIAKEMQGLLKFLQEDIKNSLGEKVDVSELRGILEGTSA